ncbi:conserved hypothetical protein [Thermoproteus tenax Kra 1]|uniref:Uncharacterized protein n=1 Tax=Thermoproteus tenax (strain ATCC 35583 / DSM 2078 / JCM 9277 / NBRC 100435 / Kra 1) TaxID=768679 RepID=G4RLR0_THETK|nr:conserved hypothetical protein [Thermoproteus tenax Kra 1]
MGVIALALYAIAPAVVTNLAGGTSKGGTTAITAGGTGIVTTAGPTTSSTNTAGPVGGAESTSATTTPFTSTGQTSSNGSTGFTQTTPTTPRPQIAVKMLPAVFNTTSLPAKVQLRLILTNNGTATGLVDVNGTEVEVPPGGSIEVNLTVTATSAGKGYAVAVINGTPLVLNYTVYYYTPVLMAEPVKINVTRVPSLTVVNITVVNLGNYTGRIGNITIPPGGRAVVQAEMNITAAGRYSLKIGGVSVEVDVVYLKTGYSVVEVASVEEAVPGERIPVGFLLENSGNATETLIVNGTSIVLPPGWRAWANYTVAAYSKRQVSLEINGTEWVWTLNVSMISVNAILKIAGLYVNPSTNPQQVVQSSNSTIPYTWVVWTNATRRTVALEINGAIYLLAPGQRLLINGTLQAAFNAWNTVALTVNGTTFSAQIYVQLTPPTLDVQSINGLSFTDNRAYTYYVSCSGTPIGTVSTHVTFEGMSGTVTYSGNTITFSGTLTISSSFTGTVTMAYSGSSTNGVGEVTVQTNLNVYGYNIKTITVAFSGGTVTQVLVNGYPTSNQCAYSLIPIPPFMYEEPPRGYINAVSFASQLAGLFYKDPGDNIVEAYYNGQYVVLQDAAGHQMIYAGTSMSGPLSITIYGSITQT